MITGSCLCGAIAYEAGDLTGPMGHCHCRTCRKAHGAAFSTTARVARKEFRWLRGADKLSSFESSPGKWRRFCSKCGSQLIAEWITEPEIILRMGCVDAGVEQRPVAHIWRSQGAGWYDPKDDLPCFTEAPPRRKPTATAPS